MNINMDLTGADVICKESGIIYRVFKDQQRIEFGTPIFAESLHVYYGSGGLSGQELVLDKDYRIDSIDENATSDAKLLQPQFDKKLIDNIVITVAEASEENFSISVTYQRLYPSKVRSSYYNKERLDLTPELLYAMLADIENLKVRTNRVDNLCDLTTGDSLIFDIDETKTNPNNYVENEERIVNVPDGNACIYPKGGCFYYDSVTVTHPDTGTTLTLDKDYVIVGMNESATKATSHTCPVFNFIVIIAPINGLVKISYHAFGGSPTIDNYVDIVKALNNIKSHINSAKALTEDTLGNTQLIVDLVDKLGSMEQRMRRLEGQPAYGDITSGNVTLMKIFSDQPGMHWYTLASLYKTTGINMHECTADTFVFRLQTLNSHFQFKVEVSVDLNNTPGNRMRVTVVSDNYPRGFIPFKDYSKIATIIRPQLRVIWNKGHRASGCLLQLGFTLTGMVEETIVIEDMSGRESCWKLVEETSTVTAPNDFDVALPDGTSVWSDLIGEISLSETTLLPFKSGHLAWVGDVSLNRPANGWNKYVAETILEKNIDISRITKVRLDIAEDKGLTFPVEVVFNSGTDHPKGHGVFIHQNMPAYVNAEMYSKDEKIYIKVNFEVTAGLSSNELKLKDMVVYL